MKTLGDGMVERLRIDDPAKRNRGAPSDEEYDAKKNYYNHLETIKNAKLFTKSCRFSLSKVVTE